MNIKREVCNHCGREYATWDQDSLRANLPPSLWFDLVCKRCECKLKDYHTWTITDAGTRICSTCFLPRYPLAEVVDYLAPGRKP